MESIYIYFDDLNEQKQKELLQGYGISSKEEMNWDVFPLLVICGDDVSNQFNEEEEE